MQSFLLTLSLIFYLQEVYMAAAIPKRIWSFWASGQKNIPFGFKLLIYRVEQQCIEKNWNFTLLDELSAPLYIQQFRIFPKYQMKAHEADLLRMQLLVKYGGFWADFGILFINGVDYFQNLKDNKYVKNKFGDQPEAFFSFTEFFGTKQIFVDQKADTYLLSPGIQVTLMGCVPQAQFMVNSLKLFKQILSWSIIFRIPFLYYYVKKNQIKLGIELNFGYYLGLNIALQSVLQLKQRQLDEKYNGGQRKLAVKYYKIWVVDNDQVGVYQLAKYLEWKTHSLAEFSISTDYDQFMKVKQLEGAISLKRVNIQVWSELLQRQVYHQNVTYSSLYQSFNYAWYLSKVCPNQHRVFKNSLVHKFLLTNNLTYNERLGVNFSNLQLPIFQIPQFCQPKISLNYIIILVLIRRNIGTILFVLLTIFFILARKEFKLEMQKKKVSYLNYTQVSSDEVFEAQLVVEKNLKGQVEEENI